MNIKILYVEDEPFLGKVVKETLEFRGYDVLLKNDGAHALYGLEEFAPDICVLDVMLPNIDGFTLCKQIREKHPQMPVIFLTAKNQTEDIARGFDAGGTDYIRKPFSIEELVLRIENQLKIHNNNILITNGEKETINLGNVEYIPVKYELKIGEKIIRLSNREAQVLNMLVSHVNEIVDRRKILKEVWGDDSFFNSRNLDVYIRRLRDYFLSDPSIRIITLKGRGYRFVVPV